MDSRAIGVFDSGLGGLCAVRELEKLLPKERIIYFGDTGRVPYGTKSDEIIKNTYRTLMTRGMKGCYVYCTDKNLANHLRECLK